MISRPARLSAIIVLGLLAPFWWGLSAPRLTIELSRFGGSVAVFVPNILLGLVAGFILTRLASTFPLKGWVLFWAALVGAIVAPELFFTDGAVSISQIFFSPGNVAFMLATLAFPLYFFLRGRRG